MSNNSKSKLIILVAVPVLISLIGLIWYINADFSNMDSLEIDENQPLNSDTLASPDLYLIDSVDIDDFSEEDVEDETSNPATIEKYKSSSITRENEDIEEESGTKTLQVNDIKSIARTLKGSSISAKTIIDEVNRITKEERDAKVTGQTIVNALKSKLPSNTQQRLIEKVKFVSVSNNIIKVRLKDAANLKLTFRTKEGRKTIKVYDGATIKINSQSSKVTALVDGFSYRHLGVYWKVKDLAIQQNDSEGTLDIQLEGKLKDVQLPTVKLGNVYRKVI